MLNRKLVFAAIFYPALAACGHGAPETAPRQQPAEEVHVTPAELQPRGGAGAELVGDWELKSDPPQRMPGIQITVTVDSATSTRFFGRLSHYFSGNVGIDPRDFEPFADSIRPDRSVVFAMPTRDREMLGIVMDGTLTADTVRLGVFVLGPDTLSNATRRWALVRKR